MKVLVVDDSDIVRERITGMLSKLEGVENIQIASRRVEAIALVHDQKPDVVILDIHLPGASGIEILKYIKKRCPDTKVIMLTNSSLPQYRKICFEKGADFFFDKSAEFDKVIKLLRRMK